MKKTILTDKDYSLIRKLEVLAALKEHGSSREVADHLEIGAAAVSKQLSETERNMGCSLFDRNGRALKLSQNGETAADLGSRLLHRVRDELLHLRNTALGEKLDLRVGFSAPQIALQTVAAMRLQAPEARLQVFVRNSATLKHMLSRQAIDLAFLGLTQEDERFACQKLFSHQLCVLVLKDDPRFPDDEIGIHRLSGIPILMRENGSFSSEVTIELFKRHQLSPIIDQIIWGRETLIEAALSGFGIGTILKAETPNHPSLKCVRISEAETCGSAYVLCHKSERQQPAIRRTIDIATEIANRMTAV